MLKVEDHSTLLILDPKLACHPGGDKHRIQGEHKTKELPQKVQKRAGKTKKKTLVFFFFQKTKKRTRKPKKPTQFNVSKRIFFRFNSNTFFQKKKSNKK